MSDRGSPVESRIRQDEIPLPALPPSAPAILRNQVIKVSSGSLSYTHYRVNRILGIEELVGRYVKQLTHGCGDSSCSTPVCLTFRKTYSRAPVRRLTLVNARAVAAHLATSEDPGAALCPFVDGKRSSSHSPELQIADTSPALKEFHQETARLAKRLESLERNVSSNTESVAVPKTRRRDPKSFTQNLFDTRALRDLSKGPDILAGKLSATHGRSRSGGEGIDSSQRETDQRPVHPEPFAELPGPETLPVLTFDNLRALIDIVEHSECVHSKDTSLSDFGPRKEVWSRYNVYSVDCVQCAQLESFVNQSLFYCLSQPSILLRSLRPQGSGYEQILSYGADLADILPQIGLLTGPIIFDSLWISVRSLFNPPSELIPPKSPRLSALFGSRSREQNYAIDRKEGGHAFAAHLENEDASHIINICFHAMFAVLPKTYALKAVALRQARSCGKISEASTRDRSRNDRLGFEEHLDYFDDELCERLVYRLLEAIASRDYLAEVMDSRKDPLDSINYKTEFKQSVQQLFVDNLRSLGQRQDDLSSSWVGQNETSADLQKHPGWLFITGIMEWVHSVLLKEWDGECVIDRMSKVGGALAVLSYIHDVRHVLQLDQSMFECHYMADRIDQVEAPNEWLAHVHSPKKLHLFSYPFIFPVADLVTYFRSINFSSMSRAFDAARMSSRLISNFAQALTDPRHNHGVQVEKKSFLVLEVRRDRILVDALDQLWRREKRELIRPMKIRMGMDEGEEGVDYGGVQQEFFRLAIAAALDPGYGAFQTDPETRLSWFQPCSLEPLYKYELLGLLSSLAIYNGATLPLNLPVVFYRKLLGLGVELEHLKDGWPELLRGLNSLITWSGEDVAEVFMRTYEISFDAYGEQINVDMERTPRDTPWSPWAVNSKANSENTVRFEDQQPKEKDQEIPATSGPSVVTTANRQQYVRDYIFWLTHKSIEQQYEAFTKGFFTCLDKKSISLFTPEALRTVVEGANLIDVEVLANHARYDGGFSRDHPSIRDFWNIVTKYPLHRQRRLLEFVTASDRIPASGIKNLMFCIQRAGSDSDRIPTSMTCFGRLALPEYSSAQKLQEKLEIALDNEKGFGAA